MKLRFHARIAFFVGLLGAALSGAALLPACGSACAAACEPILTLTVTNADAYAHSYVITMTAPEFGTQTVTCASNADAGHPICTGVSFPTVDSGQIKLQLNVNPVPFDITVTQDGAQVASAHLTPNAGPDNDVCGEVCPTGDASLALP
jgi:hypothetical protein